MPFGGINAPRVGLIPSLNGIRAVAIIIVIWGHTGLPTVIKGSTGVTIFFFLSGYLITTLLRIEADKRGKISVGDFYLRRVLRIFPALYLVLIIAVLLSLTGVIANGMSGLGLLSTSSFWANYFIVSDGRDGLPGGMNALWSLAVEEHFYLLFPLLYLALRKWLPRRAHQAILLIGLCLLIMVWRTYLGYSGASWDRLYLSTDTRADAILWGSVLAVACNPVYNEVPIPARRWVLNLVLVGSAAVFYLTSFAPDWFGMTLGYTVQSIALFGVFVPLIVQPRSLIGTVLNWKPIAFVGVISYTLYLIHHPVLIIAERWIALPHIAQDAIAVLVSVLFSYLVYRFIERPIALARKRRQARAEGLLPVPQLENSAKK